MFFHNLYSRFLPYYEDKESKFCKDENISFHVDRIVFLFVALIQTVYPTPLAQTPAR